MSKIKMEGDCIVRFSSRDTDVQLTVENNPIKGIRFNNPQFRLVPVNNEAKLFLSSGFAETIRRSHQIPEGHQFSKKVPFQLKIY